MASSSAKQEKKLIEEKIAKVREVVRNASTNDIVLALHNFDMNVEQTIHALCEDPDMALGNWEKKNGKKKTQAATQRKKDSNARSAASGSQGKQSIEMSATTPSSVASSHSCLSNFLATNNVAVVNGIGPSLRATSQKHSVLTSEIGKNIVEDEKQAEIVDPTSGSSAKHKKKKAKKSTLNSTDLVKSSETQDHESGHMLPPPPPQHYLTHPGNQPNFVNGSLPYGVSEIASTLPDEVYSKSNLQYAKTQAPSSPIESYLTKCFKEIRDVLDMREKHLRSQLLTYDADAQLLCDNSKIVSLIAQFGEVRKRDTCNESSDVEPIVSDTRIGTNSTMMKRPNSPPSSQVSSVGEDSGLGQISPVHQAKSNIAQVKADGMCMESEAFSVDQLADIQRKVMEQLKANGVDPSVLSSDLFGGGLSTVNRRRPQKPTVAPMQSGDNANGRTQQQVRGNAPKSKTGAGDGLKRGGSGQRQPPPNLSILN